MMKYIVLSIAVLVTGCLSLSRGGAECSCEKEYDCMMADQGKMSAWITECNKNGSTVKDCTESAKQIFCRGR